MAIKIIFVFDSILMCYWSLRIKMYEIPIMIILLSYYTFLLNCFLLFWVWMVFTSDQSILSYGSRKSEYCILALCYLCIFRKTIKILNFSNKFKLVEQNHYFANEHKSHALMTIFDSFCSIEICVIYTHGWV